MALNVDLTVDLTVHLNVDLKVDINVNLNVDLTFHHDVDLDVDLGVWDLNLGVPGGLLQPFVVWVGTAVAVMAGLCVTILITVSSSRVSQPALPLAITLALVTFFTSRAITVPYIDRLVRHGVQV